VWHWTDRDAYEVSAAGVGLLEQAAAAERRRRRRWDRREHSRGDAREDGGGRGASGATAHPRESRARAGGAGTHVDAAEAESLKDIRSPGAYTAGAGAGTGTNAGGAGGSRDGGAGTIYWYERDVRRNGGGWGGGRPKTPNPKP